MYTASPVWEYTQLPPAPLALLIKSNLWTVKTWINGVNTRTLKEIGTGVGKTVLLYSDPDRKVMDPNTRPREKNNSKKG
jgi:hypothetical protein